jgi:tRNA-dihydrouridine synthase B
MLPWFKDKFPLYLAPMAGITDTTFRQLCKGYGADVMVTEFVSAEGIFRKNERTLEYLEFEEGERPLGVQLFGADPEHLGEAARMVVDWKQPDFLDINFGCPVNKVVSKNGGSSLLRDCPLLTRIASAIVRAVAPVPVTAKMRIGWDATSVNATTTARALEDCGIRAIAVHGRTKEQGYGGLADWDVIAQVAEAVRVPVIGNGDLVTARDVELRMKTTRVSGVMIGRAAMQHPWIFREIKHYLATGEHLTPPTLGEIWRHLRIRREARAPAEHAHRHRALLLPQARRPDDRAIPRRWKQPRPAGPLRAMALPADHRPCLERPRHVVRRR